MGWDVAFVGSTVAGPATWRDNILRIFLNIGLTNLWFACGSPFTKTMEITQTTNSTNRE